MKKDNFELDSKLVFTDDSKIVHRVPVLPKGEEKIKILPTDFLDKRVESVGGKVVEVMRLDRNTFKYKEIESVERLCIKVRGLML